LTFRFERSAQTGLLAVCLLLAVLLLLTATVNHSAVKKAAADVLYSRARGVASSLATSARWLRVQHSDAALQQLLDQSATSEVGLAIIDLSGHVQLASGAVSSKLRRGGTIELGHEALRELRASGQYQRMVPRDRFELIMPFGPAMRPGGAARRFFKRFLDPAFDPLDRKGGEPPAAEPKGSVPPEADRKESPPPEVDPPPPPWDGRLPPPELRLLVVILPTALADPLTTPARTTLVIALAASGLLMILGVILHRAARRARTIEEELHRREALSALGEMAAVLAHEIRTPLGSIKGNAQLIAEGHPGDDRVDSIVEEAGRLERLVNGLLDYARPREPTRRPCDPDELARKAAEIVSGKARGHGVDLLVEPAGPGAPLEADPDQILQVLVNLLQNAVEATATRARDGAGGGGVAPPVVAPPVVAPPVVAPPVVAPPVVAPPVVAPPVVLRVGRRLGTITFSVLDSGPGVGGKDKEQLFRPFFTTKKQGTGLGLSVARQLVQNHRGRLELRDRKEGGLEALVSLPSRTPS
jgi:signal transduction histidine kinase